MIEAAIVLLSVALVICIVLIVALVRRRADAGVPGALGNLEKAGERLEREMRLAIADSASSLRSETRDSAAGLQATLVKQVATLGSGQSEQLDRFGKQVDAIARAVDESGRKNRLEIDAALQRSSEAQRLQLAELTTAVKASIGEIRVAMEARLDDARKESGARLDEMRTGSGKLLTDLQGNLVQQLTTAGTAQAEQLKEFGLRVEKIAEGSERSALANREETAAALKRFSDGMEQGLVNLSSAIGVRLEEIRTTLETRIAALQADNTAKLDEMRKTVDERLQSTLEARLGESFKLVSDRLDAVHKGLGEMQTLATGVGDLKRVLTNVKTRGSFGEVQLEALLEQILTVEQYGKNVATRPGSGERVEFAIKLPGADDGVCWLPIDAKFPLEDHERLQTALDAGDAVAVEVAGRALETRVRLEAKSIREKYIEPPCTTDFGILFLPTEGLYAEVLRRPGLVDALQREQKVVVAGPTTLAALLNSLQMGFRTLAIQERSAEVWKVLGAVKTEFGVFEKWLDKVKSQLQSASSTIEKAGTRTKQMTRKLRDVEALPAAESQQLLPGGLPGEDSEEEPLEPEP